MADNNKQRNDIALVIGLCLICLGVWKLSERLLGPLWPNIASFIKAVASYVWPIAIIIAGVFVIYAVRKGKIETPSGKRFYRSRGDKKIAGVCGGLAAFFGIDAVIVRIVALILLLLSFFSITLLYIILWIVIPEEPLDTTQWV